MQVSGWHSLATINTIIEIQKGVSFTNFVYLQQDYFIISDLFQDIVQIKNSCFWKIKVNCASARLMSFFSESGYANLSGPTHRLPLSIWWREREYWYISRIYFFTMFCEYCFLSIIYASVNFIRCFPLIMKQKIT